MSIIGRGWYKQPVEERQLVVVCGAGASAPLGSDGRPMPLMPELNDRVHEALNEAEPLLAEALNLRPGTSGTEFETALGEVFAFRGSFSRTRSLARLFLASLGDAGSQTQKLNQQLDRAEARLNQAQSVLEGTFFREFGGNRVDPTEAGNAWTKLAYALQIELSDVLIATTNYDPSATRGLEHLGLRVRRGFRSGASEARILDPKGNLGMWSPDSIGVIHLHGAVGWYRTDADRIEDHGADHPRPIADLGAPALLYPEPNKDPDREVVRALWAEFDAALSRASHIVVVGHSLGDEHLLYRLRPHWEKLAVMRRPRPADDRNEMVVKVRELLSGAGVIWGEFGADGFIEDREEFRAWWGAGSAVTERAVGS